MYVPLAILAWLSLGDGMAREQVRLQSGQVWLVPAAQQQSVVARLWLVSADSRPLLPPGATLLGKLAPDIWLLDLAAGSPARLPGVKSAAPYRSRDKLSTTLAVSDPVLEVVLSPLASAAQVAATIARVLPQVATITYRPGPPTRLLVDLTGRRSVDAALKIAADHRVLWIDRYRPERWLNVDSVGPIQANADSGGVPPTATPIWDRGILGTGQIVAVADSGLDRNEAWFRQWHNGASVNSDVTDAQDTLPPQPGTLFTERKVVGYWVMPNASAYDDDLVCAGSRTGYHGTHVTGTVAGDGGTPSTPSAANYDNGDGMAPNAQILFQDLGDDTSGCLAGQGGPAMWAQARAAEAYIHSNSYGSDPLVSYTASDAAVDDFLWRNEDMLIVFAAGNAGGGLGAMTISHPAHAKHVLAVGALAHGNSTAVAGFSSRGPASDGRIKPDIMAPGVSIVSALGDDNDTGIEGASTKLFSGTSMATPAIAGAAAMVRQYFSDGFYPSGGRNADDRLRPLGPLLKAVLLNGTRTYPNTPASDSGWGRVWLDNNLYFSGDFRQLRIWSIPNAAGLAQGESATYSVQVPAGQAFRATLVWYDPAPMAPAATALVNDLDLVVQTPAETLLGNVFASGVSIVGGNADTINPVEQVYLPTPTNGVYTLQVNASAVPGNGESAASRQGYALVVSAAQCDSGVSAVGDFALSSDAGGVHATIDPIPGASAYQLYRVQGNCSLDSAQFQLVSTGNAAITDLTTQGGFEYAYRVRASDVCGEGPLSACRSTVSQAPCTLAPLFDSTSVTATPLGDYCGARIQWTAGQASCPAASVTYQVHRSSDPFFTPGPGTLLGAAENGFTDYQAAAGVTHYYRVQAVDSLGNVGPVSPVASYPAVAPSNQPGTYSDGAESLALARLQAPWQLSTVAASGLRSYRNAQDGIGYAPDTCAALTSAPITLGGGSPVLSYQARWQLEANFDGVAVEISSDGGFSWQDLPPDGGYPGDLSQTGGSPINACQLASSRGAFNGDSGGSFLGFSSDLSTYANRDVRIRWLFTSDPGVELDGFYVDDITVTDGSTPLLCLAGDLFFQDSFE